MFTAEEKLDSIIATLRTAEKAARDLDGHSGVNSKADMWLCYAETQITVAIHLLDTEVRRAVRGRRKR